MLAPALIAGVFFTGLHDIDSSDNYHTIFELLSDPQIIDKM